MLSQWYGHFENGNQTYPIAALVWGHRLRAGQHWIEYMLEFLNVLAGFDYRFGQGCDLAHPPSDYKHTYTRYRRLGLRRFIFYDEREKSQHPFDDEATQRLRAELKTLVERSDQADEVLDKIRRLLRSFSAIEEDRSWYAKALFPAHEAFLIWEANRKAKGKRSGTRRAIDTVPDDIQDLDRGVTFADRNFFARGGEIYYLLISAGTEHNLELRERIASRLRDLLTTRNDILGTFAKQIENIWLQLLENPERDNEGKLGWLLDPECKMYTGFAEDLDKLLDNRLDSLETLDLMAHLIGFHVLMYIYHRAHAECNPTTHANGTCIQRCRPKLLVDLLDQSDGVLRSKSAMLFRQQEQNQIERVRRQIFEELAQWAYAAGSSDLQYLLGQLRDQAERNFPLTNRKPKQVHDQGFDKLLVRANGLKQAELLTTYRDLIFDSLKDDFDDNFLAVHRKLAKGIGFVAPRKGTHARFVLGDTLLKALVFAHLDPVASKPVGDFLELLYERYGIVIGSGEARTSGLLHELRINEEYYQRNRAAFVIRLTQAGLLTQYSDATAMVHRGQGVLTR